MDQKPSFREKIQNKLKYQLIVTFIITLVLPSFLMIGTTRIITRAIMHKKINGLVKDNLVSNTQSTDLLFRNYTTMVGTLSSDYQLINKLHIINKTQDPAIVTDQVQELQEQLYLTAFTYSEIQSIMLVTNDYGAIPYYKKGVRVSRNIYNHIVDQAREVASTVGGVLPYGAINKDRQSIYIARKVMDLSTLEHLGTLIVCIDPKPVYDLLYNHEISSYARSMILSSHNQIILSQDQDNIGNYILAAQGPQVNNHSIQSYTMPLRYFEWELAYQVDEALVMKELYRLEYIVSVISIIFLIAMITSIILVSNRFTQSIPTLILAMKQLQKGNFAIKVPVSSNNEIGKIEETFNYMASHIKHLIRENTRQYKKLIAATNQTKDAEIRALEAQINPHFLYNTLDSINWMAIEKEEYEISTMINNLAKILRYSISNISRVVTVKDEIDWLEQYLYLQKQRFVNVFDYEIQADTRIYTYKIYKLLLQPLVENAIIHGFAGYQEGGLLRIIIQPFKEDAISIEIQDNGLGLEEESITRINQLLNATDLEAISESIGVANVISRIKLYYGGRGQIRVNSDKTGTTFTLILPIIKEEETIC